MLDMFLRKVRWPNKQLATRLQAAYVVHAYMAYCTAVPRSSPCQLA